MMTKRLLFYQSGLARFNFFILSFLFGAIVVLTLTPAKAQPLPEPLTLEYVLSLPVEDIPDIQSAQSQLSVSKANQRLLESNSDTSIGLEARLRYIEPSVLLADQSNDDHRLNIQIQKTLYDFGRTRNGVDAATQEVAGQKWQYEYRVGEYKIEVMARFFDVLLADLAFIRDNEAMSIAYVRMDRGRARNELGHLSDIDLAEMEDIYQKSRVQYFTRKAEQQISRSLLAVTLNRPGELVAEIAEPKVPSNKIKIPETDATQKLAMENNALLKALRHQLSAARLRVTAARSNRWPILAADIQASEYSRELSSHDDMQAQITLNIPIWSGDRVSAEVAKQNSLLVASQALLRKQESFVGYQVLSLLQHLNVLMASRQQLDVQMNYRDLYLDRSRALYEMEVQSDLGDSMVQISSARFQLAETNFKYMLAWARLKNLLGQPIYPIDGIQDEENK